MTYQFQSNPKMVAYKNACNTRINQLIFNDVSVVKLIIRTHIKSSMTD